MGPPESPSRSSRKSRGPAEAFGSPAAHAVLFAERLRPAFSSPAGTSALLQRRLSTGGTEMVAQICQSRIRRIAIFERRSKSPQRRTSPYISPAATSRWPESRGTKISTARLETSRFRSQTPMTTVQWTLPSRWGISTADPSVILAQDSPRTSNGRALASTPCAPVWAPATWN